MNNKTNIPIESILNDAYSLRDGIYYPLGINDQDEEDGYWSNISVEDQDTFLSECNDIGTLNSVRKSFPNLEGMIFAPTRAVGLKLLDIKSHHIGIDYGCMWGNLLLYSAKKCNHMIGIDQTKASLQFLQKRINEEKLDNVSLIQQNLRNELPLSNSFDFAIINGVLEWIPDANKIELIKFFKKSKGDSQRNNKSPRDLQLEFLRKVYNNLKENGKLYLAIENRWDYQHFLWKRDPHTNLFYTAILPRKVSNIISNIYYGRPYVNYIYSINKLQSLLNEAGFNNINKYVAFPNYHVPQFIVDYSNKDFSNFKAVYNASPTKNIIKKAFRKGRYILDHIIYKKLKRIELAPAIIMVAKK